CRGPERWPGRITEFDHPLVQSFGDQARSPFAGSTGWPAAKSGISAGETRFRCRTDTRPFWAETTPYVAALGHAHGEGSPCSSNRLRSVTSMLMPVTRCGSPQTARLAPPNSPTTREEPPLMLDAFRQPARIQTSRVAFWKVHCCSAVRPHQSRNHP